MASYTDLPGSAPTGKLSKSRSKTVVKPILKKLSHSEKNSLDLDRGWDEQTSFGNYGGSLGREREGSFGGRDVSFSISATELNTGNSNGRSKFSHARSTSGTSHVSIATNGSGQRNGSFVHPFQQTPRTSTPPLSYANSFTSFERETTAAVPSGPRDYSPTITEDDDDLLDQHHFGKTSSHQRPNYHPTPHVARCCCCCCDCCTLEKLPPSSNPAEPGSTQRQHQLPINPSCACLTTPAHSSIAYIDVDVVGCHPSYPKPKPIWPKPRPTGLDPSTVPHSPATCRLGQITSLAESVSRQCSPGRNLQSSTCLTIVSV